MPAEVLSQLGETITQMIAFIIFFLVMKKYAWGPLTRALDERQAKIEEGFVSIDRRQAEADALHKEYETHLKQIEQEARTKINEAVAEGRRVAIEITEAARVDAQKI